MSDENDKNTNQNTNDIYNCDIEDISNSSWGYMLRNSSIHAIQPLTTDPSHFPQSHVYSYLHAQLGRQTPTHEIDYTLIQNSNSKILNTSQNHNQFLSQQQQSHFKQEQQEQQRGQEQQEQQQPFSTARYTVTFNNKFLESPNFDAFLNSTPYPGNNHSQSIPATSISSFLNKNYNIPPQYLTTEFLSLSPHLSTPLASKSIDLFDTPYLNNIHANFVNTTSIDEENNTTNIFNTLTNVNDLSSNETPLIEKLEKVLKTPNFQDRNHNKKLFNSLILETARESPTNDKRTVKQQKIQQRQPQQGKQPVVSNKSFNSRIIDISNKSHNLNDSEQLRKYQDILQIPHSNQTYFSNITSTPSKMMNVINTFSIEYNTPLRPKKSKQTSNTKKIKFKQNDITSRAVDKSFDNEEEEEEEDEEENSVVIDSSPSTIVINSASKPISTLQGAPNSKLLEASPTPVNKFTQCQSDPTCHKKPSVNLPVGPKMGLFVEPSKKSIRKVNTQPTMTMSIPPPKYTANKNGFHRSISANDALLSNTKIKPKKRNRSEKKLQIIMADPDQLKGNKKRRITRRLDEMPLQHHLSVSTNAPLSNSTNIVNNRSPIRQTFKSANIRFSKPTKKANENVFWES
ncbi:hypothetical protein CAS74_001963 [Pichia kudriavzevii]|uniref:Uncharacterized protein n=1 Tax=Pichia kudriavzevii TaxID=4909 RepID=A0A1Z8JSR0_PICKU|nr:hypothetical protein CAS74_001963 [Pichia kudriavzevii]